MSSPNRRMLCKPTLLSSSLVVLIAFSVRPHHVSAGPTTPIANPARGWWNQPYQWHGDATGVHMILMRGASGVSHSQVLYYYGAGGASCAGNQPRVWNVNPNEDFVAAPSYATNTKIPLKCVDVNPFCGGHSALADGRVLFPGGNEDGVGEGHGLEKTKYYDPATQSWQEAATMRDGRWYPTSTTLGNGTVLVSSGRMHKQMIAFGGHDSVSANSVKNTVGAVLALRTTSKLDGTGATNLPSARAYHTAIHDHANNSVFDRQAETDYPTGHRMIVFGGKDGSGNPLGDIWALKRQQESNWNWTQLSPTAWNGQIPAARYSHAAAFDSISKMFIVGGQSSGGLLKDTWQLQLRTISTGTDTWTRISLIGADTMAARRGHSLIYQRLENGSESRLIVFGGTNGTSYYNDVWKLRISSQDTSWTLVTTSGTPPSKRAGHLVIYDHRNVPDRMIVFGGYNGTTLFRDVWELTLPLSGPATWSQILPDTTHVPVHRTEAAGIFDPDFQRLVIMGGDTTPGTNGGELSDVWQLSLTTSNPPWQRLFGNVATGPRAGLTAIYDVRSVNSDTMEVFTNSGSQGSWSAVNTSKFQSLYPHMFLLPSGQVYYSNLNPTYLFNPAAASWTQPTWHSSGFSAGSSVMYRPGKIMKCGAPHGNTANRSMAHIDITAASPAWTFSTTGLPVNEARVDHNLTVLPNGKVLMTGGFRGATNDTNNAVRNPLIWDPEALQWQTSDSLATEPAYREYHTTALLLPDGRILNAGGFRDTNPYRRMVTIYWPPYLFDGQGYLATRPVISDLDSVIVYGQGFNACLSDTTPITKVSLIKPSAVTHSFNQEQRYLELSYTSRIQGSARVLNISAPAHGNYAPPGDYMLFVLNSSGVPSVARWVRVGTTLPTCSSTVPCYARSGNTDTETWTKTNGPYAISGTLSVPVGKTLTIEDSTQVLFYGTGSKLEVNGTLVVSGTATKQALLTSGNCTPSDWTLEVGSGGSANVSYADIRHAIVDGTLSVPSGGTLIVTENNDFRFSGTGSKIAVTGTLIVRGTSTNKAVFTSSAGSPEEGNWWGIQVVSGATAKISFADIQYAQYGVHCTAPDSVRVNNSTLANNQNCDIYADGNNAALNFAAKFNTITVGEGSGIKIDKASSGGSVISNTITGTTETTAGIVVGDLGSAAPAITSNTVSGIENGPCIKLIAGASTVTKNTAKTSKYGIECTGGSPQIGTSSSSSDNFLGLSGYGNNTAGLRTGGSATPMVRNNQIRYNYVGVSVENSSNPNLGTTGSNGNNSIYGNTDACLGNSTSGTISARGNYWANIDCEESPVCISGSVEFEGWLCLPPASMPGVEVERVANGFRTLWVGPNPSSRGTAVNFEVSGQSRAVSVKIFDVSGRRVFERAAETYDHGTHSIEWDGRTNGGEHVPSGLYFIRIGAGDLSTQAKVLITR